MVKNMALIAVVRTLVQRLIALALTSVVGVAILDFLQDAGVTLNEAVIVEAITLFVMGLVVWVVNTLGPKFSWINKIISLGLSRTGPAYVPNDADAVVSVASPTGTDTVRAVDAPPPGPN